MADVPMPQMDYEQFVSLVRSVRRAQQEYFATRERSVLSEAKRLEGELDRVLDGQPAQPKLF